MKIKYLGTAAAEGVPAIFCRCEVCRKIKGGGRQKHPHPLPVDNR